MRTCFFLLATAPAAFAQAPATAVSCDPSGAGPTPQKLSETCLYKNIRNADIAAGLRSFTPNFQLWTDGARKSRWIYLPPGRKIDTADIDRWVFPVGTQFFKEFRKVIPDGQGADREIKVETRHLRKVENRTGKDAWVISTYAWLADQSDAILNEGSQNVSGTPHDIPTQEDCIACHNGNRDFILGFETLQLDDALQHLSIPSNRKRPASDWTLQSLIKDDLLTHPPSSLPVLPGSDVEQKALGYLHGNCGGCHNPLGLAAEQDAKHLRLRHIIASRALADTDVYKTAVNQRTHNFTTSPYIVMGGLYDELAVFKSAVLIRMLSLDENYRMPRLGTEEVDYEGVDVIHKWIMTIETPDEEEELDDE